MDLEAFLVSLFVLVDDRVSDTRSREPKSMWCLEEASHCDAYFSDRQAYCEKVGSFFEEHL
jgi:hypothetical protein